MGTMIVAIGRAVIESEVAVAGALEMMKEPAVETETPTGTTTEMGSAVMIVQTRIMLTLAAVGEGAAIEIEGMVVEAVGMTMLLATVEEGVRIGYRNTSSR